jgi:hypothetical protein
VTIPARYDKWILCALTLLLSRVSYFPGHGIYFIPLRAKLSEALLDSLAIAAVVTILYVILSAFTHWGSTRTRASWITHHRRSLVNALFTVLIAALLTPIPTHAVRLDMPSATQRAR